jgi:hypothetical protein
VRTGTVPLCVLGAVFSSELQGVAAEVVPDTGHDRPDLAAGQEVAVGDLPAAAGAGAGAQRGRLGQLLVDDRVPGPVVDRVGASTYVL